MATGPMTISECKAFAVQKKKTKTNFRYNNIDEETAGDFDQFNASRIRESLNEKNEPSFEDNLFKNERILKKVWFKNENIDSRAVINTFKYIFLKFKKGIFVRISNNELQTFLPFENANYKNEFGHILKVDPKFGSVQYFLNYVSKLSGFRSNTQAIKPLDEWVANNSLVRYDYSLSGNRKIITRDMLITLCKDRSVPDIEFFINDRDFPLMKIDGTEPYNHIWGGKHHSLQSHNYDKYAPILSCSATTMHADILVPTYEDWARVTFQKNSLVFPLSNGSCREYPDVKHVPWLKKTEKAVFRGSSTGSGVTSDTNQRLKALEISQAQGNLLDAGITKWNLRPRKLETSQFLQTIVRKSYPVANKLDLQEQSKFKYILTLEGHVAAYRLSYELSSGSVILLAESQWKMWYSQYLKPFEHFVPVKEDLSDLITQIEWCKSKSNDIKCSQIAQNARLFYDKYLGTKGILDFLQKELWELSSVTKPYLYLPNLTLFTVKDEKEQLFEDVLKFTDEKFSYVTPKSFRCVGILDGMLKVMRSKALEDLEWGDIIHQNINGRVDVFSTNGFGVVGKKASNKWKALEHTHESYIGLKAINKMVSRVPNFSYIFGPLKNAHDMVFAEFIHGLSFMDWLKSPQYNFKEYLSILVQLNLALSVAQNFIGFIHYDLYPWNVMIQSISNYQSDEFTYFLNFQSNKDEHNAVTIKSTVVPVMIDYGKSRAIIYESKYGIIDHGFTNLYQSNSILDTLTILYGSLSVLKDANRFGPNEMMLLEFPKRIGLSSHGDLKRWTSFRALFDFKPKTKSGENAVPKNFVDFIMSTFNKSGAPGLQRSSEFKYQMEKGMNPIVAESVMKTGNKESALFEIIKHIDRSRPVESDDKFFQLVALNMLSRRIEWLDKEIESSSRNIKEKWRSVRKLATKLLDKKVYNAMPEIDFPKPKAVYLDEEISYNYLMSHPVEIIPNEDWLMTWILCLEAYLFDVVENEGDFGQFICLNGFLYHNAVASNNTLLKLRDKLKKS
jgi:hypothetical protein